ncbi:tyrosine protein kinase [Blastocystis sp. subtype 4]|uniref:tyrosine protein kinase n=1 Tax=Blastocystis sp. subtype 4 TaxID=944170 RepID=UPI000711B35D|nr:tyrosine protein kinase [Blastocystis sp. subtype 4]KNB42131.1 tyrosine protein kinase [Blastocystis sp. subtype 4]|eukprot:XP_014525574.1 tyrosine protein kinase [Blastocystis sp. subtype 4]
MDYTNKKRSQKEIFSDAYKDLTKFNTDVTTYLINDMFQLLTQYQMVLDGVLIRQFGNGNDVAIIRSRVRSQYCGKDYYIPVSILYPISGCDTDHMRIFLIVSKNTTVNKQCSYINQQTNEVLIDNLDTWRYTDGLTPVVTILQNYFASICPIFEINPSDVSIPFSELVVKEKLGSGTSADVYRGIYQGRSVALKKMRKIPSQVEYRYLLREFQTQIRFKHSCILEILGHSEAGEGFPVLVMELGGPSLENLIIKKGVKYSNVDKRKFILDIAMALEYLHSFNVVHRDIKLANVLLTNGTAKIADFGYAREIGLLSLFHLILRK